MKHLILILFAFAIICGCNDDKEGRDEAEDQTDANRPGVWYTTKTGNYLDGFVVPKSLRLYRYEPSEASFDIRINSDEKYLYKTSDESEYAKYEEYAKCYGDTSYTYYHDKSPEQIVCSVPLKSINVVADRDFDESHPAGTSLNDLFTFKYLAFYSYINNGYKRDKESTIHLESPTDSVAVLSEFKGASMFSDYLSPLCLNKRPATSGKYTFTVTLTFGEDPLTGEKVELAPASIEIEF